MLKKVLLIALIPILLIAVAIVLIMGSSAEDEKLKKALRDAGLSSDEAQILCADKPIAKGQIISERDVYEVGVDLNELHAGSIICIGDVVGKRAAGVIQAGEPVTAEDIGLRRQDHLKSELERLKNYDIGTRGFCSHPYETIVHPLFVKYKAKRDIPAGERIKITDFKSACSFETDHFPCVTDIRLIVNHASKFGIEKGQLLHAFDIDSVGKYETDVFVAARDLKPEDIVKLEDIEIKHFRKGECSVTAILEKSMIPGSKVLQPIAKGQVFRVVDLYSSSI